MRLLALIGEPPLRRWWRMGGLGWIALVIYLSLTPEPPDLAHSVRMGDKVGHLLAYAWLAGWHAPLYRRQPLPMVAALILLGVALELLQGWGGVRLFEWWDMVANSVGALLGWLAVRHLLARPSTV